MPTEKPRIFVTFEHEQISLLEEFMQLEGYSSKSSAVSHIVDMFLLEYFLLRSTGVTLL